MAMWSKLNYVQCMYVCICTYQFGMYHSAFRTHYACMRKSNISYLYYKSMWLLSSYNMHLALSVFAMWSGVVSTRRT